MKKQLQVSAIENGTVIDHLPSEPVFEVTEALSLSTKDNLVLIATNIDSQSLGKKGIIKIGQTKLDQAAVEAVSLLAPGCTINTIEDYEVIDKTTTTCPKQTTGLVKCVNPNCITNHESTVTQFRVTQADPLTLLCHYCQKTTDYRNLKFTL